MRSLVAVLVLIGFAAVLALSQDSSDFLITPGYAIGGISVGMELNLALAVLGPPQSSRSVTGTSVLPIPNDAREYSWPNGLAILVGRGTIYAVEMAENAHYFLPNELHVGVSGKDIRAAMGNPPRVVATASWTGWAYDDRGVAFYLRNDSAGPDAGVVFRIDVYKPHPANQ
jgi:hypothetical protein